jgi:hypothetical protein
VAYTPAEKPSCSWLKKMKKDAYRAGFKDGVLRGEANARAMLAIAERNKR